MNYGFNGFIEKFKFTWNKKEKLGIKIQYTINKFLNLYCNLLLI